MLVHPPFCYTLFPRGPSFHFVLRSPNDEAVCKFCYCLFPLSHVCLIHMLNIWIYVKFYACSSLPLHICPPCTMGKTLTLDMACKHFNYFFFTHANETVIVMLRHCKRLHMALALAKSYKFSGKRHRLGTFLVWRSTDHYEIQYGVEAVDFGHPDTT